MAGSNKPIVIAHHIMWTLYGWWLPNDLRGSTSRTIRNDLLAELGELHFGRKNIQPAGHDIRAFYEQAAGVLQHPLLSFQPDKFPLVADAIGQAIQEHNYTCYACAIMPDHVHLLIRKHRDLAEEMIEKIQTLSRKRLIEKGLREATHPVWTRGGWKVFLDHPDEVRRTIRYIDDNPLKLRLPAQHWEFVKPYDNWPLHSGHSPNSPYVRALRAAGRLRR
jgi:REP element-mobilizing transposase RayT